MPPILLFVDTSAWYALLDRRDRNHAAATRFAREAPVPLVKRHLGQAMATRFGHELWKEKVARLVRVSPEDEAQAWNIFTRYVDKGFSYTDCTSFALMTRLRLDSAFAFDVHFDQYDHFVRLPSI